MVQISSIDYHKYQIVHQILALRDEQVLRQIEHLLATFLPQAEKLALPTFVKPLQNTLSIDYLQKTQHYVGFNFGLFSGLCKDFETEESIEDLLAML